jgi:hypothetical protein
MLVLLRLVVGFCCDVLYYWLQYPVLSTAIENRCYANVDYSNLTIFVLEFSRCYSY